MNIVGYSDHFSVKPGRTMRFMVSSRSSTYHAALVRLRHTDTNRTGPGFKTDSIESSFTGDYPGHEQAIYPGSYVEVPADHSLALSDGFTLQAWIYPTTPGKGIQGLLTHFSGAYGYGLYVDEDSSIALWLGDGIKIHKISTKVPLLSSHWYFVTVSYDAVSGKATVHHRLASKWPMHGKEASVSDVVPLRLVCDASSSFLIASSGHELGSTGRPACHFNGKIDNPKKTAT